jgi:hypothetical protein
MQRRVGVKVAGLAAVLGLGLAGCGASNTPTAYEPLVEKNFLEGCTNHYVSLTDDTTALTDNTVDDEAIGATEDQCRCMYETFVDNVPFNGDDKSKPDYDGPNFTELDKDLDSNNPGEAFNELPEDVKGRVSGCVDGPSGGSTTTTTAAGDASPSTETTTAGDTTTTTAG